MLALLCGGLVAGLAAVPAAPLSWADLAHRARPGAGELEAEALLAEAQRALALTGAHLVDGPSLTLSAGPRRGPDDDSTDVDLEIAAPLLAGSGTRRDLAGAIAEAAPVLRTAARADALQRLGAAHADAWFAAARLEVRRADVATLERWLDVTQRRVEGGAEPPFEAALVEADLAQARTAAAIALADQRRAWGELAALADVPSEPVPLASPAEAPAPVPREVLRQRFEEGAARQAVAWRGRLRALLARVEASRERSRLSLVSSLEREGEDDVALVGVAYRLPRARETAAATASLEATEAVLRREAELESAALGARFASALETVAALEAAAEAPDLDAAMAAVELRLAEGKDRPSQALAVRRQLLSAREAALERVAALARAHPELTALTTEVEP